MIIRYTLISQVVLGARFSHDDYQYGKPYHEVVLDSPPQCETITIPMCENIGYNHTSIKLSPFHHQTQHESGLEAHQFYPLVNLGCSDELRPFLCSLYSPICMENYRKFLPPCRFLCERARKGCEPLMEQHGFSWPEKMDCELFPEFKNDPLCNHFDRLELQDEVDKEIEVSDPQRCETCSCSSSFINLNARTYGLDHQQTAKRTRAINQWHVGDIQDCAMPCKSPYLNDKQRGELESWMFLISVCAILSTLMVQSTFLLDNKRFAYPERPIVFLSFCYLFVAVGYLMRYFIGPDKIACEPTAPDQLSNDGGSNLCKATFVLIYYFGMASSIWWVMLTFAWFLAAGMKWSSEAISSYGGYMHLISWLLPAVQTIIIGFTGSIDGDPFLGVCGVGNTNIHNMHVFILAPLVVYLSAGGLFLIVGFISLLRIRTSIKKQGKQTKQTHKLEKLIVKIFIFSILYMIPAAIRIICYFYESENRQQWEYDLNCDSSCGTKFNTNSYYILLTRTFMELLVGITAFFWILGKKTVYTWKHSWHSVTGCGKAATYEHGNTTISTASTITTQDNSFTGGYNNQPIHNQNVQLDNRQNAEFHYQYCASKPLL